MADGVRARIDLSQWQEVLDRMDGPMREALARRMAVTGGQHLRDTAKLLVPNSMPPYNADSTGSRKTRTLEKSIYLAFDTDESTKHIFTYRISWNTKIAWWGKLVEFGFHHTRRIFLDKNGVWHQVGPVLPKTQWRWVPAKPFLRPAYDVGIVTATRLMMERGRKEATILLSEIKA